jgi:auxin responsive GH3 family protein
MSQVPASPVPCKSLTPKLHAILTETIDRLLLNIIRANFSTQYASQAPSLAQFRDVVSAHGMDADATLLQDFRSHVALMDYESYRPFVARFNEKLCKESDVENLFAPGLPLFLAQSSSTSGKAPKTLAKYNYVSPKIPLPRSVPDSYKYDNKGLTAWVYYFGYWQLKEVQSESGQVVKQIPLCIASGGMARRRRGWSVDEDEARMSTISTFPLPLPLLTCSN